MVSILVYDFLHAEQTSSLCQKFVYFCVYVYSFNQHCQTFFSAKCLEIMTKECVLNCFNLTKYLRLRLTIKRASQKMSLYIVVIKFLSNKNSDHNALEPGQCVLNPFSHGGGAFQPPLSENN